MRTSKWVVVIIALLVCNRQTHAQADGWRIAATGRSTTLPAVNRATNLVFPAVPLPRAQPSVSLLNSIATASPAESFAISGTLAYVCDDNEISVVDISNPSALRVVSTIASPLVQTSGVIHCGVQGGRLFVFADQAGSKISGPGPGVTAFSLSDPAHPALLNAVPIKKRFFQDPVYVGNYAFVPTVAVTFFLGFQWDGQYGDLLSVDLTNPSNPTLVGTLGQPQVDAVFGAQTVVLGATQADAALLYLGGSTSTGSENNGTGRLQVVDITRPGAMRVSGQLLIPGTVQFTAPLIQGTIAVGIGTTGGYENGDPPRSNITVSSFDVTDRRAPAMLSTTTTSYKAADGGGATRIGNYLFAFAGVSDSANSPVLLIVDVTDPGVPVVQNISIPQPITSMHAVGSTLFATLGSNGFAAYSIPGVDNGTVSSCPASVDAILVVDRGAQISGATFANMKAALKSFLDSLHSPTDQSAVVSFASTARLDQPLTVNGTVTKAIVDSIVLGGTSYIGAGIAAAQQELSGARRNQSSAPVIVVLSDGGDASAPSGSATAAAAATAKTAGVRIISVQYGSTPSPLMQSIATSAADFYLVSQ